MNYLGSVCGALTWFFCFFSDLLNHFGEGLPLGDVQYVRLKFQSQTWLRKPLSSSFPCTVSAARTSGAHQRRCCSHTHYSHLTVHFMLESVRFCIVRSPILFKWDEGTSSFLCQLVIYAQHALMRLSSRVFRSSCKNHTNRVKCS